MTSNAPSPGNTATLSMEGILVQYYMIALDRLQECWNNDEGLNVKRFEYQILYLIRTLPDPQKQKYIINQWLAPTSGEAEPPDMTDAQKVAWRGMRAVTEVIKFICETFDLTHSDIIGPATNKQFVRAPIEIDDMTPEILMVPQVPGGAPEEVAIVVGDVQK